MSEKILDRIKKLFALANNNANQHEREVALKAAHELMNKHNIEQEQLKEKPQEAINQVTTLESLKFIGVLICGVAALNHCFPHARRNAFGDIEYFLIGTPDNIAVTLSTMEWLTATIRREANSRRFAVSRERAAFMFGMAAELQLRCKEMLDAEKMAIKTTETKTQLMVIRDRFEQQNAIVAKAHGVRMKYGRSQGTAYGAAFSEGRRAGREVNLGKQITEKTKRITQRGN